MLRWLFHGALALCAALVMSPGIVRAQGDGQNQPAAGGQPGQTRVALVIGNYEYAGGRLGTTLADAGLVAATLREAGYDVVEGGNLNTENMRRAIEDFLQRVADAGADAVPFVYYAGSALQVDGDTFLAPVDAQIENAQAVSNQAFRLVDLMNGLAGLPARIRFIVVDGSYPAPFPGVATGLTPGLSLLDPPEGVLLAYGQMPNAGAPAPTGNYSPYATALAELIREPGIEPDALFQRVRLRVHELTMGVITPWHAAQVAPGFTFFERPANQPPPANEQTQTMALEQRQITQGVPAEEAYAVAVGRGTIAGYEEFLQVYPSHQLSQRIRVLVAQLREAEFWERCAQRDTPEAYWTYLRTYPRGYHLVEARRRLTRLQRPAEPPADFEVLAYADVPPPPPEEIVIIERRVFVVNDLPPPPPVPVVYLPPRPVFYSELPPPRFVQGPSPWLLPAVALPVVAAVVLPRFVRRPPPPRPFPGLAPGVLRNGPGGFGGPGGIGGPGGPRGPIFAVPNRGPGGVIRPGGQGFPGGGGVRPTGPLGTPLPNPGGNRPPIGNIGPGGRPPIGQVNPGNLGPGGRPPINVQGRPPIGQVNPNNLGGGGRPPVNVGGGRPPINVQGRPPIGQVGPGGRPPINVQGRPPVRPFPNGNTGIAGTGRPPIGQGRPPIGQGRPFPQQARPFPQQQFRPPPQQFRPPPQQFRPPPQQFRPQQQVRPQPQFRPQQARPVQQFRPQQAFRPAPPRAAPQRAAPPRPGQRRFP